MAKIAKRFRLKRSNLGSLMIQGRGFETPNFDGLELIKSLKNLKSGDAVILTITGNKFIKRSGINV